MKQINMQNNLVYHGYMTSKLNKFRFGNYALVAKSNGLITDKQLNAIRIAVKKKIRNLGQFWICIKPNKVLTSKPCGTRMGRGKGSFDKLVYYVKKDEIIIEIDLGRFYTFAKELLYIGSSKLSVKTYILFK